MRPLLLLFLGSIIATGQDATIPEDPGLRIFRDRCSACHLQTGMGIREMNAPSIAALPRWYVSDQLRKFRRDERGFHKDDASGHLMQANAAALDERMIAFVGRYIENLETNPGRNTLDLPHSEKAKRLYLEQCAGCHGKAAEGNRKDRVPPLTSQQDWYLLKQMENFLDGRRIHSETYIPTLSPTDLKLIIGWISGHEIDP